MTTSTIMDVVKRVNFEKRRVSRSPCSHMCAVETTAKVLKSNFPDARFKEEQQMSLLTAKELTIPEGVLSDPSIVDLIASDLTLYERM